MKKKILNLLALMLVLLIATPVVARASEAESVDQVTEDKDDFVLSKFGIEASFPEKYRYIYDESQGYRDEVTDIGIHTNEITSTIKENGMSYDAFYIDDEGYLNEAYMSYAHEFGVSGDLKDCSDDELEDLLTKVKTGFSVSSLYGVSCDYLDSYHTEDGEVFFVFDMKSLKEDGDFRSACYFTIVNGDSYYFYFRSYNPNILIDDLVKDGEDFVEGVKFTGRPEKVEDTSNISDSSNIASDSNIITGPKTNKTRASKNVFASRTLGRAAGAAILVGASFLVNAVKRKKNDKW